MMENRAGENPEQTLTVAEALTRAVALHQQGRLEQAETLYEAVLQAVPGNFNALHLLGVARHQRGRHREAATLIQAAIAVDPRDATAHNNLGNVLRLLERHDESVASCRRAIELQPDFADAYNNLGNALWALGRVDEAISWYRRGLETAPNHVNLNDNLAVAFSTINRDEEAIAHYRRALELGGDHKDSASHLALCQRRICDWTDFADTQRRLIEDVRERRAAVSPFVFLAVSSNPQDQRYCAEAYAKSQTGSSVAPVRGRATGKRDRVRLAYLSSNFRDHPLSYNMVGLFERHDRQRFEVFAISCGTDDGSVIRRRVERAFEHFIDVRFMSDADIARRIAELEIDIAIDRDGYTTHARTGILACRPAPVQVNYMGYPGTLGTDYIDYVLADPFVVPPDQQPNFSEKVVHLPDTYWVTNRELEIADETPSRATCGLPDRAFVFCCFNNSYKLTPAFFDIWVRLLRSVPGSVLWLLSDNDAAERNLRREVEARGVDPGRLVFAPRMPLADHLARHRLANVFLDTLPVNAHTTASDALWVGLPVVTCVGQSFASRVAGSLLHAVGLPELVTESLEAYEALALDLATDPARLAAIRETLARNRTTTPLFDTDRFRRGIERAYVEMWERWRRGEPPAPFAVPREPNPRETGVIAG